MTENLQSGTTGDPASLLSSYSDLEARHGIFTRIKNELFPANKAALFDALVAAGIAVVVVTFDGGGDEGQIESVEASTGDNKPIELPGQEIELQHAVMDIKDETKVTKSTHSLPEAIARLVYELLGQARDGWENGEGAYGEFTFDVETRTITLDFNERFIDSENSTYEF